MIRDRGHSQASRRLLFTASIDRSLICFSGLVEMDQCGRENSFCGAKSVEPSPQMRSLNCDKRHTAHRPQSESSSNKRGRQDLVSLNATFLGRDWIKLVIPASSSKLHRAPHAPQQTNQTAKCEANSPPSLDQVTMVRLSLEKTGPRSFAPSGSFQ